MTAEQAAEACVTQRGAVGPELSVATGQPQAYQYRFEPKWLVVVPGENSYGPLDIVCTVYGTAQAPLLEGVGEHAAGQVDEQYIEMVLNGEGGM